MGVAVPTGQNVPVGQMTQSSRVLRKPPACARIVWLAWVPPGHGCGELAPSRHRYPLVQSTQLVAPRPAWYLPDWHSAHVAAPGKAAAEPGRHSAQELLKIDPGTGLAVPTAHSRHELLLDAPRSGLYVPAGHCSKVIAALAAPSTAQKPPSAQSEHAEAPATAAKVPTPHAVHSPAPLTGLCAPSVHGNCMTEPLNLPAHTTRVA